MGAFCRLPNSLRRTVIANRPSNFIILQCSFSTSTLHRSAGRTYTNALELLEKLQSNREVRSAISDTSGDMNLQAMPEMLAWTRKAGYSVQDLARNGLRYIHVAGTKGKGSVCVMIENILMQYRARDGGVGLGKIGLYTSPHLVHVRERIRIDGSPISETLFARYFFELWDRLSDAATLDSDIDPSSADTKPGYFRYLTLLAFHTFMQEGVENAIVECGIGGEYDSTNILPVEAVTVTAITPLGIDHAGMLGDTLEDIAWHKSGIMKTGVPAYTAKQKPEAQAILEMRASEKDVKLAVVGRLPVLNDESRKLGLDGDFQRDNASLAAVVAASHLKTMDLSDRIPEIKTLTTLEGLPKEFVTGLETAIWPGRCQYIKDGNIEWFIDGAHTEESLKAAATWFATKVSEARISSKPPTATMLIFNQQDRDAYPLLNTLMKTIDSERHSVLHPHPQYMKPKIFTYAAFCPNLPFKPAVSGTIDIKPQIALSRMYSRLDANQLCMEYESAEEAVELVHKISEGDERPFVLVTGSLHLVGAVLKVLDSKGVDITARYQSDV